MLFKTVPREAEEQVDREMKRREASLTSGSETEETERSRSDATAAGRVGSESTVDSVALEKEVR